MNTVRLEGIKALLFDFEGTLVDSQWNRPKAVEEALKELADLGLPAGRLRSRKPGVLLREAMGIARESGIPPEAVRERIEGIYDRYDEDALTRWSLRPNLMELLDDLNKAGIRTGIVSNAGRTILIRALEKFHIRSLFDVIVSRDDVRDLKPSGEGIERGLQSLRVPKAHALYIGDTPEDVLAARAAGLKVGILLAGGKPSGEMAAAGPDFSITDFEELLVCFRKETA